MSDDLKRVYTGSRIEALFLRELLQENGIGCLLKKTFESSVQAGWVEGPTQNDAILYVETFNFEKAEQLLNAYFKSREE